LAGGKLHFYGWRGVALIKFDTARAVSWKLTDLIEEVIQMLHLTETFSRRKPFHGGRWSALILMALLLTLAVPLIINAQVLYGTLTGNVTDSAGASVPGAKVEVVNVSTGEAKETTTNESGVYQFTNLQAGTYKVTIALTSFKTVIKEDIKIEANVVRRFDAQMEVGDVRETVNVTADSDLLLQTDRADINTTQTTRQVNDLPLSGSLGRNYQSLMTIIPGAVSAGEQNSVAGNPQRSISYNVNGVSRLQNNTRIDGAGVVYPWLPTNTVYVPPAESIQTVNIVTNSFDAEQGLAGGAAINLTIKSGTNDFHGAVWGYDTNSRFLARSVFQPANQPKVPKNILAQFGYSVSGPIIKNKLFFFTDLERTTSRSTARTTLFSIAPASLRPDANGNVSFAGTGTTIYDPLSNPNPALRTPFAGNVIPANRIDIAALELIKRMPLPNVCATCFSNNFAPTGVAMFNRTNFDVKINYNASEKLTMFGRYSYSPTIVIEPSIFGEAGGDALNGGQLGTSPSRIQVAGLGGTYIFTPNVVLDANFGYTRQRLGAENVDIDQNLGLELLKIPGTNGPDRLQGGLPAFQFNGFWANLGNANTGNPFLFRDNQYLAAGNLSWLKGAHSFRFGVDYQNQQLNHFQPQGGAFQTARGTFVLNGGATALQGGASPDRFNTWASFLLGLPTGANTVGKVTQLRNPNSIYMQSYAIYVRDHWQITRNLTFTYGLRWERYPFPVKDNSGINRFDPADGNIYTGGLSGVPRDSGASSGPGQFLPRVGLAYRLNDKTVLRGGYGQSADPRPFIDFRNAYPIVNNLTMPQGTFNGLVNNFVPVTTFRLGIIDANTIPDLTQGIIRLPPNTNTSTYPKTPMRKEIHSFNFIIERDLPWRFVGQVGYVGTRAVGQMGFININASAPGTGNNGRPLIVFGINADVNSIQPFGTATYDAMQAKVERRFGGSILGATYTWSKAINYADNDANPRIPYLPEKERNRGPAGYDRTHNFEGYMVYDLPFGKGQQFFKDGVLSKLLGGWQINSITSYMSGAPFYVVQNTAANLNAAGSGQVPNQINPVVAILHGIGTPSQRGADSGRWFDITAFASENGAKFGNVGRNTLRGPEFFNVDMGIFRTLTFTERFSLQLRAEALNALNHPNFGNPQSNISDATNFGYVNSTVGQASRQWRFAARFSF
jgi:hypothetical protein